MPGLSREEIVTKLRPLNIPIPEDLIQLYSWRNGQVENADWELDSLRFRDTTFINLDAAVKQYDDFRTAYGEGCTFENTGFDMDLAIPKYSTRTQRGMLWSVVLINFPSLTHTRLSISTTEFG